MNGVSFGLLYRTMELWCAATHIQSADPEVHIYPSFAEFTWSHIPGFKLRIRISEDKTEKNRIQYVYYCRSAPDYEVEKNNLDGALHLISLYEQWGGTQ